MKPSAENEVAHNSSAMLRAADRRRAMLCLRTKEQQVSDVESVVPLSERLTKRCFPSPLSIRCRLCSLKLKPLLWDVAIFVELGDGRKV